MKWLVKFSFVTTRLLLRNGYYKYRYGQNIHFWIQDADKMTDEELKDWLNINTCHYATNNTKIKLMNEETN